MNPLLEVLVERGLLWDSLGIVGLALLTAAAASLASASAPGAEA